MKGIVLKCVSVHKNYDEVGNLVQETVMLEESSGGSSAEIQVDSTESFGYFNQDEEYLFTVVSVVKPGTVPEISE